MQTFRKLEIPLYATLAYKWFHRNALLSDNRGPVILKKKMYTMVQGSKGTIDVREKTGLCEVPLKL